MPRPRQKASPLKSKLRLFLSVDIVGSTAFKQKSHTEFGSVAGSTSAATNGFGKPWLSPFSSFYLVVDDQLAREWARFAAEYPSFPLGARPEFWKSLGDELLYTKELLDHREALSAVFVWMKTIEAHRDRLRKRFPQLDLKMTAWIAGFPVHNWEILFRSSTGSGEADWPDDGYIYQNMVLMNEYYKKTGSTKKPVAVRDFIGPSIDTGFRLCSLSSPRRFIVSIDLVFLILSAGANYGWPGGREFCFVYEGRVELKGVLGGQAYPVVWIDIEGSDALVKAERAVSDRGEAQLPALLDFCRKFLTSGAPTAFLPYIDSDPTFQPKPPGHEEFLRKLEDFWIGESKKRAIERQSAALANTDEATGSEVSDEEAAAVVPSLASTANLRGR